MLLDIPQDWTLKTALQCTGPTSKITGDYTDELVTSYYTPASESTCVSKRNVEITPVQTEMPPKTRTVEWARWSCGCQNLSCSVAQISWKLKNVFLEIAFNLQVCTNIWWALYFFICCLTCRINKCVIALWISTSLGQENINCFG